MDALGAASDSRDSERRFGFGESDGSGVGLGLEIGVGSWSGSPKGTFFLVLLVGDLGRTSEEGDGSAVGVGVGVASSPCSTTGGLCFDFLVLVRAGRGLAKKQKTMPPTTNFKKGTDAEIFESFLML